jgi:hypothetical protein
MSVLRELARSKSSGSQRDAVETDGQFYDATHQRSMAMNARIHKFKVGQTVNLIPSVFRSAAPGLFEIVSLRPAEGETPQYRIKNGSESHERIAAETDLIPFAL